MTGERGGDATAAAAASRQPRRAMLAAALTSTLGFLPVYLLAAQGVLVREELQFDEARLGVLVSAFFGAGALLSAPGGRLNERLGPWLGMLVAGGTAGVVLVLIALAPSWPVLVLLLALAGGANALAQTAADLSVARGVPKRLQGFAFGVKTSCTPLATLAAGVAIPAIGVRFGWRTSFFAAAAVVALVAAVIPRRSSFAEPPAARDAGRPEAAGAPLFTLAVAGALSIGAVNTMGAFYAESAVQQGLSPSAAGWWLAAGSIAAVAARIGIGAVADRIDRGHWRLVAVLWVAGGIGMALLAPERRLVLFGIATALTFVAGSGWVGLFHTAVVRANPTAPATATGLVMTGQLGGSVLGPIAFGAAASRGALSAAWIGAGASLLLAAALLPAVERMLARRAPAPAPVPAGTHRIPGG